MMSEYRGKSSQGTIQGIGSARWKSQAPGTSCSASSALLKLPRLSYVFQQELIDGYMVYRLHVLWLSSGLKNLAK